MDTSKGYIEMCQKATEIQEQCPVKQSKKYRSLSSSCSVDGVFSVLTNFFHSDDQLLHWFEHSTWLPRQDQLQEMMIRHNYYKIWDFYEFAMKWEPNESFPSMEQLWLMFIMKTKYSKEWIDNDWRKIDE